MQRNNQEERNGCNGREQKRRRERCFPSLCPSNRSPCVPTAVSTRPRLSSPCLPLERANDILWIPKPDCLLLLWTVPQHPCSVTFGSQHCLCAYSPLSENGGTDKTHKETEGGSVVALAWHTSGFGVSSSFIITVLEDSG